MTQEERLTKLEDRFDDLVGRLDKVDFEAIGELVMILKGIRFLRGTILLVASMVGGLIGIWMWAREHISFH